MGFSIEQHGLYILALVFQFNNGHFSEDQINGILNNQFNQIKHKFKTDGKFYWNERLDREKEKRQIYVESRQKNGRMFLLKKDKPLINTKIDIEHMGLHSIPHMENENRNENSINNSLEKIQEKPLWKTDFSVYEKQASEAFDRLVQDTEWMAERKKYHPNLDIYLSCEKAFNDFWGQETGWQHKRKSKTNVINWDTTYKNALTLKSNQVYEKRP